MSESNRFETSHWQSLWSAIYGRSLAGEPGPGLNLAGWTSSYTGLPIPEREMREWIDRTVERIAALAPRRLLEVGCGMGLLLERLAPTVAEYQGIDFSAEAVSYLERRLAGRGLPVTLHQRAADDLDDFPAGAFDTVVVNSVVQYFPGLDYLRRVLAGLRWVAAPGAKLFLGDLRHPALLAAFHASVLLRQADAATPLAALREQLALRLEQEAELLVAPEWLFGWAAEEGSGIAAVEIQLKRGRARNELARFRYDALVTLDGGGPAVAKPAHSAEQSLDWRGDGLTLSALRRRLAEERPPCLRLVGVPNARLVAEVAAERLLGEADPGLVTVADLQAALAAASAGSGPALEPEDFWALAPALPYEVAICWGQKPETFDVGLALR